MGPVKQLSGLDTGFLMQEHGNQRPYIAALAIYDPSTAPGGSVRFKAILDFFTQRVSEAALFRRRLAHVPLDLDRPYWVEEGSIDVEYHVRHIALPQPGDWRQLMIQIARIQSRALDLAKPTWEAYIIEGLDNIPDVPTGSFAMYIKLHHAAVDGGAGTALIKALHSLTPRVEQATGHAVTIADREPTALELLSRMANNRVGQLKSTVGLAAEILPLAIGQGRKRVEAMLNQSAGETGPVDDGTVKVPPRTRFSAPLSPHRVIEALSMSMADISAIRRSFPGITVNDVFISICSGAVRRYLQAKGELPELSLNAAMPMDTRSGEATADEGNQIGIVPVPAYTNVANPAERLRKIHSMAQQVKQNANALGNDLLARVFGILPASAIVFASEKIILPTVSFTVSNIRGPDKPLYLAGAQLQVFVPINILLNGLGLSMTGFSYNGRLWICAISDRKQMPDPNFFAQCYQESIAEHMSLAGQADASVPPHTPDRPPAGKRKKSTARKSSRPRRRRA